MNSVALRIYHGLPGFARDWVASLRGVQLKRWRYGPDAEQLVEEALQREQWSHEQWACWQEKRLGELLHRAATRVPYYRELWAKRRRQGDPRAWEVLGNWPILAKETVRATPAAFLADDCDSRRMFCDQTSGTSGTPLKIWLGRNAVQACYAIFEARLRRWNGVSRHERWAILGGQQVVAGHAPRPPFWVRNWPMRQLYLSANHISKANAPAYWEAIEEFRPTHLVTYASSAAALAKEFVDLRLRCSTLKVVLTNAEPLLLWQRELITATIAPVVRESYGMAETVAAASECAHGHLHFWPETGHIEVVADVTDDPAPSGTVGRLVSTGLLNRDMPLIRYLVGDRCSAPLWNEQCSCGRRLPTLPGIEGRTNDLLVTKDGRKVFWINPVFYGLPVGEAQVIQETLDEIRVCVVPSEGFSAGTEATIRARLCDRLGLVNVSVTKVDSIPRGPNGKFRAVVTKVSQN